MDRDSAGITLAREDRNCIEFNSQQTQEAPDYDLQLMKVHDQQCSSFPNSHEHIYDYHAPVLFPSEEREDHATRYMYPLPHRVHKGEMFSGMIKEISPHWSKNSTHVNVPHSSPITLKKRPEDYVLAKQKDNADTYHLHEDNLLHNQLR